MDRATLLKDLKEQINQLTFSTGSECIVENLGRYYGLETCDLIIEIILNAKEK